MYTDLFAYFNNNNFTKCLCLQFAEKMILRVYSFSLPSQPTSFPYKCCCLNGELTGTFCAGQRFINLFLQTFLFFFNTSVTNVVIRTSVSKPLNLYLVSSHSVQFRKRLLIFPRVLYVRKSFK